jgi:hypothetical protein
LIAIGDFKTIMKAVILAPLRRMVIFAAALALPLSAPAEPALADGEPVMAVPELHALTPEAAEDAARITAELRQRFQALPSLRVVEAPPLPIGVPGHPDILLPPFEQWRDAHVDIVLVGTTSILNDGRHQLLLRIWNVETRTQLVGEQYVFGVHQGHEQEIADHVRDALLAALQKGTMQAPR